MSKELPRSISINDAVSYLVNIDYTPNSKDVIEMMRHFLIEAQENYDNENDSEEKELLGRYVVLYQARIVYAKTIWDCIEEEIDGTKKYGSGILKLDPDSPGEDKILVPSLLEWSRHYGFGIDQLNIPSSWINPIDRHYQTDHLAVIDDIIKTFCEETGDEYDEKHIKSYKGPDADKIKEYVERKYPKVSKQVRNALPAIVRKGLTGLKK